MKRRLLSVVLTIAMLCTMLPAVLVSAEGAVPEAQESETPLVEIQGGEPGVVPMADLSTLPDFKVYLVNDAQWGYIDNKYAMSAESAGGTGIAAEGVVLGSKNLMNSPDNAFTDTDGRQLLRWNSQSNVSADRYLTFVFDAPQDGTYYVSVNQLDEKANNRGSRVYIDGELAFDFTNTLSHSPMYFEGTSGDKGWRWQWTTPKGIVLGKGNHVIKVTLEGGNRRFGGMLISNDYLDVNTHVRDANGTIVDAGGNKLKANDTFLTTDQLLSKRAGLYSIDPDVTVTTTAGKDHIDLILKNEGGAVREYWIYDNDDATPTKISGTQLSGGDTIVYRIGGLDVNENHSIKIEARDCVQDVGNVPTMDIDTLSVVYTGTVSTTDSSSSDNTKPSFSGDITIEETMYTTAQIKFPQATDDSFISKYEAFYKTSAMSDYQFCGSVDLSGTGVVANGDADVTMYLSGLPLGQTIDLKVVATDYSGNDNQSEIVGQLTTLALPEDGSIPQPEIWANNTFKQLNKTVADVPMGTHIMLNETDDGVHSNFISNRVAKGESATRHPFWPYNGAGAQPLGTYYKGGVYIPEDGDPEGTYYQVVTPILCTLDAKPTYDSNYRLLNLKIDGEYILKNGETKSADEYTEEDVFIGRSLTKDQLHEKSPMASSNCFFWEWGPVIKLSPGYHQVEVTTASGTNVEPRFCGMLFTTAIGYDWTKLVTLSASFDTLSIMQAERADFQNTLGAAPYSNFVKPQLTGSIVSENITSDSADISWPAGTDDGGVVAYHVYYTTGTEAKDIIVEGTNAKLERLQPSSLYAVKVAAVDAYGNESTPIETSINTRLDDTIPAFPSSEVQVVAGASSATVSWKAAYDNSGIDHYVVMVKEANAPDYVGSNVVFENKNVKDTSCEITGLKGNTSYVVKVRAIPVTEPSGNVFIESEVFTTLDLPFPWFTKEDQIESLGFAEDDVEGNETKLNLAWPVAGYSAGTGEVAYEISIGTSEDAMQIVEPALSDTKYVVSNLLPNQNYIVKVRVYLKDQSTVFDDQYDVVDTLVKVCSTGDMSKPVFDKGDLVVVDSDTYGTVSVSWPAASDASGIKEYQLFYKLNSETQWPAEPFKVTKALTEKVTGLISGAYYDFKVVAVSAESTDKNEVSTELVTKDSVQVTPIRFPYFEDGKAQITQGVQEVGKLNVMWGKAVCQVKDAVVKYHVYLNGTKVTGDEGITDNRYTFDSFDSTAEVKVEAFVEGQTTDAAAGLVTELTATFEPVSDTTAPVFPTEAAIQITEITATGAQISWPQASDETGVKEYKVYVNGGDPVATISAPVDKEAMTFALEGLIPNFLQNVLVVVSDQAGNTATLSTSFQTAEGQSDETYGSRIEPLDAFGVRFEAWKDKNNPNPDPEPVGSDGETKSTYSNNMGSISGKTWGRLSTTGKQGILLLRGGDEIQKDIVIPEDGYYYVFFRGSVDTYTSQRSVKVSVTQNEKEQIFQRDNADEDMTFLYEPDKTYSNGPYNSAPIKPIYLQKGTATYRLFGVPSVVRVDLVVLEKGTQDSRPAIFDQLLAANDTEGKALFDSYYFGSKYFAQDGSATKIKTLSDTQIIVEWSPLTALKDAMESGDLNGKKVEFGLYQDGKLAATVPSTERRYVFTIPSGSESTFKIQLVVDGKEVSGEAVSVSGKAEQLVIEQINNSLTGEAVAVGDQVEKVDLLINNKTAGAVDARFMLALYKDNAVVQITEKSVTLLPNENLVDIMFKDGKSGVYVEPNAQIDSEKYTAKLYIWNGSGYIPLN